MSVRPPLLVVGAGGHAAACIDVIEAHGGFSVLGLIGTAAEAGRRVAGHHVVGTDDDLPAWLGRCATAVIGVGQIKSPDLRIHLYERLRRLGFQLPAIVSPRAYVSRHASIGEGTIVMHGAIVNAEATVGRNCILNTLSLIEHGSTVSDHCHVATSAVLNSGVHVGDGTFIGSNSVVRQSVTIGKRCVIGMGQRVLKDCGDGTQVPAGKGAA